MKTSAILVALFSVFAINTVFGAHVPVLENGVYNYHLKIGVPEARRIKLLEDQIVENGQRIAGGSTALISSIPYQVGLLVTVLVIFTSVCGGTIVSDTAILTAAHCQNDGANVAQSMTVILGSNLLYSGGTRFESSDVILHPGYNPNIASNNIAIIRVPRITFTNSILPATLPSGSEVNLSFVGSTATASGYGATNDGTTIGLLQTLNAVNVPVISNEDCQSIYGNIVQSHHLCTSGVNGRGICYGDTGGPLTVIHNGRRILIGIGAFYASVGCTAGFPGGFTRIGNFVSWIIANY